MSGARLREWESDDSGLVQIEQDRQTSPLFQIQGYQSDVVLTSVTLKSGSPYCSLGPKRKGKSVRMRMLGLPQLQVKRPP